MEVINVSKELIKKYMEVYHSKVDDDEKRKNEIKKIVIY